MVGGGGLEVEKICKGDNDGWEWRKFSNEKWDYLVWGWVRTHTVQTYVCIAQYNTSQAPRLLGLFFLVIHPYRRWEGPLFSFSGFVWPYVCNVFTPSIDRYGWGTLCGVEWTFAALASQLVAALPPRVTLEHRWCGLCSPILCLFVFIFLYPSCSGQECSYKSWH